MRKIKNEGRKTMKINEKIEENDNTSKKRSRSKGKEKEKEKRNQ